MKTGIFILLFLSGILAVPSCKKPRVCDSCPEQNKPPIASAGADQVISLPTDSTTLSGIFSADPENNITDYAWSKLSGPASFSIANAQAAQTQVKNLVAGTYLFQLKVTDAFGLFSMDTVQVMVNPPDTNSYVDIYVAGELNAVATYWKNGNAYVLGNPQNIISGSLATAITVAGKDVYAAGWEGENDFFTFTSNVKYWKNGREVLLNESTDDPISIAVDDNDVYLAGSNQNGTSYQVAIYWKNGTPVRLTDGRSDALANCITVVGGNVYVAGRENGIAKYWKNKNPVALTDGRHPAEATSIVVVGNDVYAGGWESNGTVRVAKYWKNGQPVTLTNGIRDAGVSSIAINGSNIYVAGWEVSAIQGGKSQAIYWKNGQPISLTNGVFDASASSIACFGSDVYVCGNESNGTTNEAKYWKNGPAESYTLTDKGSASSIAVVKR